MKEDNKIDITEYINPDNELSDEMIQAYLDAADIETPDLWNGIEAGFDRELNNLERERKLQKARRRKYAGIAAAAVLITIIALPVILMSGRSKESKSDTIKGTDGNMINESMDIAESQEYDSKHDDTVYSESAGDEAYSDSACTEAVPTDENDSDMASDELSQYIILTADISMQDEIYIVHIKNISEITYENYDIKAGDRIEITNPQELEKMLIDAGIDIDALGKAEYSITLDCIMESGSEYAEYEGRITELEKN